MENNKYSISRKYPLLIKDYLLNKGRNNLFEKEKVISHKHFHLPDNHEQEYHKIWNKEKAIEEYNSKIPLEKLFSKEPASLNDQEIYFLRNYKAYKKRLLEHQELSIEILNTYMNHEISLLKKYDLYKKEIDAEINELKRNRDKLFDRKLNKLKNIDPFKFEKMVANIFQEQGYETEVTSSTGDGGIDIILYTEKEKILVQCKRYNSTVSSSDLRTFLGTLTYNKVKRGFFVTTGKFSKEAQKISDEFNIELFDGVYLNKVLKSKKYTDNVKNVNNKISRLKRIKERLLYNVFGISIIDRHDLNRVLRSKISDYNQYFKYLIGEDGSLSEISTYKLDEEIQKILELRNTCDYILNKDHFNEPFFSIGGSFSNRPTEQFQGVTDGQLDMLKRFFGVGYSSSSKFEQLGAHYPDSTVKLVRRKANGEILFYESALKILSDYINEKQ